MIINNLPCKLNNPGGSSDNFQQILRQVSRNRHVIEIWMLEIKIDKYSIRTQRKTVVSVSPENTNHNLSFQ